MCAFKWSIGQLFVGQLNLANQIIINYVVLLNNRLENWDSEKYDRHS